MLSINAFFATYYLLGLLLLLVFSHLFTYLLLSICFYLITDVDEAQPLYSAKLAANQIACVRLVMTTAIK